MVFQSNVNDSFVRRMLLWDLEQSVLIITMALFYDLHKLLKANHLICTIGWSQSLINCPIERGHNISAQLKIYLNILCCCYFLPISPYCHIHPMTLFSTPSVRFPYNYDTSLAFWL